MASSIVLPSQQLASFRNQQLGGLMTGSDTGIGAPAALNALQKRVNVSPVGKMAAKTQNSVLEGAKRLSAIASQGAASRQLKARRVAAQSPKAVQGGGQASYGPATGATDSRGWVDITGQGKHFAAPRAAAGFQALMKAASGAGHRIGVTEAGRTRARQQQLYNLYKSGRGNLAAKPGTSVHESGNAIDINGYGGSTNSPAFRWLRANAAKFGYHWIGQRYGEPWHWEYKG